MSDQRVIIGNSLRVLKDLEPESIDVCVTSPPYWGLRDYGSDPEIYGGDDACAHEWSEHREPARGGIGKTANVGANKDGVANNRGHPTITAYCAKCGAWRGQLGLEPTPQEYIEHLCGIFDEVKRVLKPTGACWVNLGDTYNGAKTGNTETNKNAKVVADTFKKSPVQGLGQKSLVQIPARFAIAMCDRGWILRNEIIWHKPNVMPQSVKDRFTVDHEKFYFFTKEPTYYFNQVKEPALRPTSKGNTYGGQKNGNDNHNYSGRSYTADGSRNARTTWSIPTKASGEDHCAMFPPALIDIPIRACCPPGGTVLDPFCGSGTTLEYCRRHDINGLGIEINPRFKEIIDRRSLANIGKLEAYE